MGLMARCPQWACIRHIPTILASNIIELPCKGLLPLSLSRNPPHNTSHSSSLITNTICLPAAILLPARVKRAIPATKGSATSLCQHPFPESTMERPTYWRLDNSPCELECVGLATRYTCSIRRNHNLTELIGPTTHFPSALYTPAYSRPSHS